MNTFMQGGKFRILAMVRGEWQAKRYSQIFENKDWLIQYSETWRTEVLNEFLPDIVVGYSEGHHEVYNFLQIAREQCIPSLLIMDGLLEWRHQWLNPRFGYGDGIPYLQPISYDKVACYGWRDLRTLETWGNIGKCELIGAPRLDSYLRLQTIPHDGPKRLLILSANTPGYTPGQKSLALNGFRDLQQVLVDRDDIEVVWRLRKGLDQEMGVTDDNNGKYGNTLIEIFPNMDAVISQPSTVVVESMLVGLPTAIIDYPNTPQYISAAWRITAREQILPIIKELLDPLTPHRIFQDELLHNQLECHTPATPRLQSLIERMVLIGRQARESGASLNFPGRIVSDIPSYAIPSTHFTLADLYPDHPILANRDLDALRIALTNAQDEIRILHSELETRKVGYWLSVIGRKLTRTIRNR